ncbi:TonB-dependent receptor domain-containing protein [Winogradskyella ursingii]|uniref:TonB-dependent receptor domain-containing protein n=1 Tax=Winogradskyella ursingii TaxID=2686079 RepID=UPI001FEB649C|nr:outer membrane beta-barrel family protein [Winogradskyella ursingii]
MKNNLYLARQTQIMIPHLRFYFFASLFAVSFGALSQNFSVSGQVLDTDNRPIELANVLIFTEENGEFLNGTSTGVDGSFKLSNLSENTYFLTISFIGYEEVKQKIVLTGNLDLKIIQLTELSETLDEVSIIAKKPTISRKPDRLIFNVENTALIEGSTLQVLKSTPGVIVSDGDIKIKSASAAVYINNRRVQLTSSELTQLLESSSANSIKSIEVITNPPASYDADSGSVINIIMSKNLVTGYRGSVFTDYTQGVFPRYNAGTSHYFKNDKFNLNVNYNYTNQKINRDNDDVVNYLNDSNDVEEVYSSRVNRNTWSETHNLNLNFDYYINDNNTLSLTSTGLYLPYFKYQINNNTVITDDNGDFLSRFTADNLSRDNKYNIGTDLIFRHVFENQASLTLNGHFTLYDYERDQSVLSNFFDENNMFEDNSEFNTLANQDTQIITAKADYSLPIDDSTAFDVGVKFSNVNTESDITRLDIINGNEVVNTANSNAFNYDENVFAGYANFSKSWEKWDLNLGIRVEQTDIEGESPTLGELNTQEYLNWFPNASLSHNIAEEVSIYGNYKRSITRPSYTDLNPFTFFLNENTVVVGNPNLTPTYKDHYNFGINFLEYFTVEAYYDNYSGAIEELPRQNNETNIIAFTPTNIDKMVDYGFDFLFQYYKAKWGVYSAVSIFNITEEVDFGNGFVELNQWSNLVIIAPYALFLEDNSLNVNLNLTWISDNLQNLQTVEGRLISELSISKSILKNNGIISLSAGDLFNYQNFRTRTDYLNQSSSSFVDVDTRFVQLGFRYKFGNTKLQTNERSTSEEERERLKDLQ